jgi:L-threonylcarbamoyladenylate synthase
MTQISSDISKAIELLNKEDVVAIPTETVYGLAGNIYSEKAIRKIFQVKQRPLFNPLIVHIPSIDHLEKIAREFPVKAQKLAEAFWPGSLTLILPKRLNIPEIVTGGKDTVGVRIPNHPVTLSLLKQLSFPLAAPSANPYNRISPTSSDHVKAYFENTLSMVLEGGECKNGIESTIIGFENNEAILYRLGGISVEDIEKIIGKIQIRNKSDTTPNAPGMLAKHYAPKTKMYLLDDVDEFIENNESKRIGVLRFKGKLKTTRFEHIEILSKSGDLKEAASKLYSTLHKLDSLNLDLIVAERFPDVGLGKSINDRLERATK